jgi:nitric oxide dioxygenase
MMLNMVVTSLNALDELVPKVQALGRRHGSYGVKDEHYPTVGAALLWTLEKGLGSAFTAEAREAWTLAYGVLSKTMMEAAQAVPA